VRVLSRKVNTLSIKSYARSGHIIIPNISPLENGRDKNACPVGGIAEFKNVNRLQRPHSPNPDLEKENGDT
jgi:hypothetical protein